MTTDTVQTDQSDWYKKRKRPGEAAIKGFLFLSGALSIATTIGIIVVLAREALLFFFDDQVSLTEFLTGTNWQPTIGQFGIFPLVLATLITTGIALLVAIPLGLLPCVVTIRMYCAHARSG